MNVEIANEAVEAIRGLPKPAQKKVLKALDKLRSARRPAGIEKLGGHPSLFRIKAGEYRIVFTYLDDLSVVVVLVIRHRKDAYRGLDVLDRKVVKIVEAFADRHDKHPDLTSQTDL
jgi:mRNA interferase RelE/StbE